MTAVRGTPYDASRIAADAMCGRRYRLVPIPGSKVTTRGVTWVSIVAVATICWLGTAHAALDMYGSMTGLSSWLMHSCCDGAHMAVLWLMWATMMAAMMLPSAMPLLAFYDRVARSRREPIPRLVSVNAMALGYLLIWAAFSVGATGLQRLLSERLVLTPMMEMASSTAIGFVLVLAGIYQLTPFKQRCLRACRSPLTFVLQRWRKGVSGALRMGAEHGLYCLGCCWALMLLLFAGGVMNLAVIVGLTVVVLVEKLSPVGVLASRWLGAGLAAAGIWMMIP